MGRAARRQQERQARRQPPQTAAPRSMPASVSTAQPGGGQRRGSLLRPRWATDIISELKKVTWPSRAETTHLTMVVVAVSLLFGVILGGADLGFSWLIEQTVLK